MYTIYSFNGQKMNRANVLDKEEAIRFATKLENEYGHELHAIVHEQESIFNRQEFLSAINRLDRLKFNVCADNSAEQCKECGGPVPIAKFAAQIFCTKKCKDAHYYKQKKLKRQQEKLLKQ